MTDAELDQQRAGTLALGFCPEESSCGASVAQIISGDQTVPIYNNTCPPDCSIIEGVASPGETVRLQQHIQSGGSVVTQRNTWTAAPATRSVTVLPATRPANPNLPR